MRIGILSQTNNKMPLLWQRNSEIYTRTEKRIYQIADILKQYGHSVKIYTSFIEFHDEYCKTGLSVDLIFYAIESCFNRNANGILPAFFTMNNVPFIGNDLYVNVITSDKVLLKDIASHLGFQTPLAFTICKQEWLENSASIISKTVFPCVLKYRYGSMSYHTAKIDTKSEFINQVNFMLNENNGELLCEEYIDGRELTVPIIGNSPNPNVLAIVEYKDNKGKSLELYDTLWKGPYDKYVTLKPINDTTNYTKSMIETSLKLYQYLDFCDFGRFDFRLSKDNVPYLLEANPIPALAYESAFDPQSYGIDITFGQVINEIVLGAAKRNGLL